MIEDIERFLAGCEYDPANIPIYARLHYCFPYLLWSCSFVKTGCCNFLARFFRGLASFIFGVINRATSNYECVSWQNLTKWGVCNWQPWQKVCGIVSLLAKWCELSLCNWSFNNLKMGLFQYIYFFNDVKYINYILRN